MEIESYIPDVLKNVREFVSLAAAENPALENVSDAVDTVKAEQFVNTSDEAGIKRYEAIVKITPKGTDTLDERKFAVLTKYNAETPFTEKKVNEILTSLCGEGGKLPASTGYLRAVKTVNALGRNLIDARLFSDFSIHGVTVTNNKNGSLTISGTADTGTYPQSRFNLNLDKGTYYVGCFSDDNNLSYDRVFRVRIYASSSSWHEYTIGSSFTVTGSEYAIIALIQVDGGNTFNGTIWPILTKNSAVSTLDTYTRGYSYDLDIDNQTCTIKLALINKKMRDTVNERLDEILPLDLYLSVVIMYNQYQTFKNMTHTQMKAYTHRQLREEVM